VRRHLSWALAGVGLALGTMAAPLRAQARADGSASPIPPASALPGTPTGFVGYTFCRNGLAESWVRADLVGSPQMEEILAHEAVHRQQAAQFPTCEAWLATLSSAKRVIEVELPAYCAQRAVGVSHGEDGDQLLREYALRIAAQSGAMENRLDILQIFKAQCTP
jgi:hypothetical protein